MGDAGPRRPFRLTEIESWPECREVIVEGGVGPETIGEFEACLTRALESPHDLILIDLDRCEAIDVEGAKQLLITRQRLSDQRREMLLFGAEGKMREILERIGALEPRPAPTRPSDPQGNGDLRSPANHPHHHDAGADRGGGPGTTAGRPSSPKGGPGPAPTS
jgi:anti-anti-sigma regulatory factor